MPDNSQSHILGWVAGVESDEDNMSIDDEYQQSLIASDEVEADPNFEPDDEEAAPVPHDSDFPIGNRPPHGKWGLNKRDERLALRAHRKEQGRAKKRERTRKHKQRKRAQKISDLSTEVPSTIKNVPTTAMTSLTAASIGFGLKTLDVNATAPSISTGLANIELMPTTRYRNRRRRQVTSEHAIGTIKEEKEPEVVESKKVGLQTIIESSRGRAYNSSLYVNPTAPSISTGLANIGLMPTTRRKKRNRRKAAYEHAGRTNKEDKESEVLESTKVGAQMNIEPSHGQAHESSEPGKIATATTTPKPRARRLNHTQYMIYVAHESRRRHLAWLREHWIEQPLQRDLDYPIKTVHYKQRAVGGGGFKIVQCVARVGRSTVETDVCPVLVSYKTMFPTKP